MKRYVGRGLVPLLVSFGLVACGAGPATGAGELTDQDRDAIRAAWDAIVEAEVAEDWETVVNYVTEDYVHIHDGGPIIEGRAAWLKWANQSEFDVEEIDSTILEMDGQGDMAYITWTATMQWTEAGEAQASSVRGMSVFRKQADGRWLSARTIWNAEAP